MNVQLRAHQLRVLAEVLCKVENEKEMLDVLKTILTNSEQEAIAQRFSIINKIQHGVKYYEIESALGTSASTISKAIDLYLKNGQSNHNFNNVIKRYKEPEFKYVSDKKHYEPKRDMFNIGTRALIREQKNWNERIARNRRRNANPQ